MAVKYFSSMANFMSNIGGILELSPDGKNFWESFHLLSFTHQ